MKQKIQSLPIIISLMLIVVMAGCGKNETIGGAFGATTGGIVGAAVAGKRSSDTGLLVGALLGGLVGGSVGRAADHEEDRHERDQERRLYHARIDRLEEKNAQLQHSHTKWCQKCKRSELSRDVKFCEYCPNSRLIYEKVCPECHKRVAGNSPLQFCGRDGASLQGVC